MSYCRCDRKSDVYAYGTIGGGYSIHLGNKKTFEGKRDFFVTNSIEFLKYLIAFRSVAIKVPQDAIDRVKDDIIEDIIECNNLVFPLE